jgi:SAM-dependent methyltransferase
MADTVPYRDFYYPLNVFMHILIHEEGAVTYLHYGLFESEGESIAAAQERSTDLLLSHLPSPPARLLDVGIGIGTTLARLKTLGYSALGITPDDKQIAMVRDRYGEGLQVWCSSFENFVADDRFDAVIFQESSQYIDSEALFAKAREVTSSVVVLDEFATKRMDAPGALHSLPEFLEAAERNGFRKTVEIDVSAKAAPTIDYFTSRLPRFREALIADLGLTSQQVDELISSGEKYYQSYRSGIFTYRLLTFSRQGP